MKTDANLAKQLRFAKRVGAQANRLLLRYYGKARVTKTKAHAADIVTQADVAVDSMVQKELKKTFPDHNLFSEESVRDDLNADHLWICDPLDGTRNFRSSMPLYGFLLAYAQHGELKLGIMVFPTLGETYVAVQGKGATKNGKTIHCSSTTSLKGSYGITDAEASPSRLQLMERVIEVERGGTWSEAIGCGAYAASLVARGVRDYIQLCDKGGVWDYAAPQLILQEAGCIVTQPNGNRRPLGTQALLGANPALHASIVQLLKT